MTAPERRFRTPDITSALRGLFAPRAASFGINVVLYIASFAVALGIAALLVSLTDATPGQVITEMYNGSLKYGSSFGQTIDEATPILIVALGVVIATRAGIINIGTEGQLLMGATVGTAIGLNVPGPGGLVLVFTIVGAAIGGALWAGVAAALRFTRGVDIVISTLLLNFVANQVLSFLVNRESLLRETTKAGQISVPQSDQLPERVWMPRIGEYPNLNFQVGVFLAIALVVLVAVFLTRSRWGFRIKMLGLNEVAARRAGVRVAALGGGALLLSGAFAGAAGGTMLTGTVFRVQPGFSNDVGFDGLLVALIARGSPMATVPVAFFFGMLRSGGGFLASAGVPSYFVGIVKALLVLAALFPPLLLGVARRRRELRQARAAARATPPPALGVEAA